MRFHFAEFALDDDRAELMRGGDRLELEPRAFRLLARLLARGGGVMAKDELLDALWPGIAVTEASLTRLVHLARTALDDRDREHPIIRTLYGRGYQIAVPVCREADGEGAPAADQRHRVAVLPFEDLSGEPDPAMVADALTEELITSLAGTPSVDVIARTSTLGFKGGSTDVREVGRVLGALYVVEGSVRRSCDRVRIVVQLLDAETGSHLWAERYDAPIADLFDGEDSVVDCIAAQLHPQLLRAEARRAASVPAADRTAWALYHQALDAFYMRGEGPEIRAEAQDLLDRALELDPLFAPARAMRAALAAMRANATQADDASAALRAAQAEGRRAVEASPDDPLVLHHWATIQREVEGAEASVPIIERALELGWNDPHGWAALGLHLFRAGRREEAIASVERAIKRSPKDPRRWSWEQFLSNMNLNVRNWERALEHAERATELNERFPVGWLTRAALLTRSERLDDARVCLDRFRERAPGMSLAEAEAVWRAVMPPDDDLRGEIFGLLRKAEFK